MLPRVLETARHLLPSQVLWRLRYAVERRRNRAWGTPRRRWAWKGTTPPPIRDDFPALPRFRSPAPRGERLVRGLARGVVEHLGRTVEIGRERPDWGLGEKSEHRLWTATLHYMAWVDALAEVARDPASGAAGEAAALLRHYVTDWIRRCGLDRPGSTALAWNAYAIATRLEWWIRAFLHSRRQAFEPRPEFEETFLGSLWQQAAYLHRHVEWDLRGNHLMRDARGLAAAGRFFGGEQPRSWLERATGIAVGQAAEQVLPDGGHFERSSRYHVEVMQDLLVLALLVEDPSAGAQIRRAWAGMAEHLAWMRHPDGDVPLFNDAALLGNAEVAETLGLGDRIGVPVDPAPRRGGRHFADTGMAVWHGDPWSLFFDVGPVGPDYQPGHAHADTLSIECSFGGRRVFVDPGTLHYDDDDRRRYDRATKSHNTVSVDDADSSEVWRIFRVGRRARMLGVTVEVRGRGLSAVAAHDGFDHLRGEPRHRREVTVTDGGALSLDDRVVGSGDHRAEGGLLIAPSWRVEPTAGGWRLADGDRRLEVRVEDPRRDAGRLERFLERRPYHPRYGVELETTRIGWRWRGDLPLEVRTVAAAD